ncbi:response regulator [Belliella sp. DSM 111904]|uniref:histidine kinase n=1 Tax=Belliella filtrata TaxID=2923435 RepID=A0ABS9V5S5_9BACT|nr:hybrid sensor histidine kinase/response regulator transcription factor [Belliella filtrata]MCH7411308.1 response regulator [Belliella filtrata]
MKVILLYLLLSLLFTNVNANIGSYYFKHFQVEQGLSHNTVMASVQDKDGFIWFGTKDGLNRFDGYRFKVFRQNSTTNQSLKSNFITSLYSGKNHLWVGTDKGLFRYNKEQESFDHIEVSSNFYIREIKEDINENLWYIAGNTLYKIDQTNQHVRIYDPSDTFLASSICMDNQGSVWASSNSGMINRYDPDSDTFVGVSLFDDQVQVGNKVIEKLHYIDFTKILVGTQSDGIKLFNPISGTYTNMVSKGINDSELFVRDFLKINDRQFWVATESGVFIIDIESKDFTNLKKNYNDPYSLSDNAVYTLLKDQEGGIWAGTYFGGLNYLPKQYTPFERFFPKSDENSISGNAVREIVKDKRGKLWIGTEDAGLNRYDPTNGTFINYMLSNDPDVLTHNNIHGLLIDGEKLWVGTFFQGLYVIDIVTGKIIKKYASNQKNGKLENDFIYAISMLKTGQIVITTNAGIFGYNKERDTFESLEGFQKDLHYTSVFEDSKGNIWAGTYTDGLYVFDITNKQLSSFKKNSKESKHISSDAIHSIFEDQNNQIWITTASGLNKINQNDDSITIYTTADGLPSNVCYQIEQDEDKMLWISTSKGLVRFNPESGDIQTYTKDHGILSDQFNYRSSFMDKDGTMYFGSVKGLIKFNYRNFLKNEYLPPVFITGLQIGNDEVDIDEETSPLRRSIIFTDKVALKHNQSSFSLDVAALSFTAPEIVQYAYKLEGFDNEWIFHKTNRKISFTKVPPGKYTFLLKSSNSNGVWSDSIKRLEIHISPPFWATYWAYLIYFFAICSLIAFIIISLYNRSLHKNRERMVILEREKEKEIYNAKIKFFTNVAHEIRTPLTLIKGPLEKLQKQIHASPSEQNLLLIMEKNTSRLLELVNQLMDFRKTESKEFSLNFVKVNLVDLLEDLIYRFSPIAEQKKLTIKLEVDHKPAYAYIDREAMTKVFSNLLNNALKFSDKLVEICISSIPEDKSLAIYFKNDGSLINDADREKIFTPFYRAAASENVPGTGIGLPLATSLVELHSGTIQLEKNANLNIFKIQIPIEQQLIFDFEIEHDVLPEDGSQNEVISKTETAILIVEDNLELLDFLSQELKPYYAVYTANNGNKALDILEEKPIQLIVSDIMMPGMDGISLCQAIKSNLNHSHIPILILTAKSTLQSKIEGLESGADAYIEKPFAVEHLIAQVSNLLKNKVKVKEYYTNSPIAHLKTIAHSKADEEFLEKLNAIIYGNLTNPNLNVDLLADNFNMSRPTLYRKIKAISDLTPNELINLARLKKAAELLSSSDYKIYEVADLVGYNSQNSFTRNFHKQFGMTPTEYTNSYLTKAR